MTWCARPATPARWYDGAIVRAAILVMWAVMFVFWLAPVASVSAQPEGAPTAPASDDDLLLSTGAIDAKIAVMSFDALGIEPELVARLESLFRSELERLSRYPMPSLRTITTTVEGSRELKRCTGDNACLAKIGRALGVDAVVSGSVAALGDSYILNIKVVNTKTGQELRRLTTEPLRGNPDELIEAMRVAAYRLLAPEQLLGSLSVLTDIVGATVRLDGNEVGKTPLPGPLYKLGLGPHKLEVAAKGYMPFADTVEVRFQKTTRVVVRLATRDDPTGSVVQGGTAGPGKRPYDGAWYTSTWFYVGVGVAAGVLGGYIGYELAHDSVIDCGARPDACAR